MGKSATERALQVLNDRMGFYDWTDEDWESLEQAYRAGRYLPAKTEPWYPKGYTADPDVPAVEGLKPGEKYRLYFAYGSNLHKAQMSRRCPKAVPVGRVVVPGWRLRWNGVLSIERDPAASIMGAVWATTWSDEDALDRYEGCDRACGRNGMYRKERIEVYSHEFGTLRPYVYIMNRGTERFPGAGYLQTCLEGAHDFGIPTDCLTQYLPNETAPTPTYTWVPNGKGHHERRKRRDNGVPF